MSFLNCEARERINFSSNYDKYRPNLAKRTGWKVWKKTREETKRFLCCVQAEFLVF